MKNKQNILDSLMDKIVDKLVYLTPVQMVGVTVIGTTIVILSLVGILVSINWFFGIKGFGPERTEQITVQRLFVDNSKSSHYMVFTDKGVFEVDNFLYPRTIFNADELYGKLEAGKTFEVVVKGNKMVNFFFQQYPYIVEVK